MGNKTLMALAILILLLSFLHGAEQMKLSFGEPELAIIIGSDGIIVTSRGEVINPSTAPIKKEGSTYYLTDDLINNEIWVNTSNITLDGNGHSSNRLICVTGELNITIQNWTISGGSCIGLFGVSNVSVLNNNLTGGDWPWYETGTISVDNSSSVRIVGNTIGNGDIGVLMTGSRNNLIMNNNITGMSTTWDHTSAGITLYNSSNNTIYHNNFINNNLDVDVESSFNNSWDDGYPSGGNYWGDYQTKYPKASEMDKSGIWATPYVIDADNIDFYPLMNQANSFNQSPDSPLASPTVTDFPNQTNFLAPSISPPTQKPTAGTPAPSPSIPEFPSWILLPLLLASTLLITYKMKGPKR